MIDDIINLYSHDELMALAKRLAWNPSFGCFTRLGFEHLVWPAIREQARYIIYFDVDSVHQLNEHFGSYDVVDRMIRGVFEAVRHTDYKAGQYQSGDEFLICLCENKAREELNPQGMANRLIKELKQHGLTATFAVAEVTSPDLATNIKPAIEEVFAAKKARGDRR